MGKGLTFDSGGYNLKAGPGSMIELMKFDMGGAAATLGAAKIVGQLAPADVEVGGHTQGRHSCAFVYCVHVCMCAWLPAAAAAWHAKRSRSRNRNSTTWLPPLVFSTTTHKHPYMHSLSLPTQSLTPAPPPPGPLHHRQL